MARVLRIIREYATDGGAASAATEHPLSRFCVLLEGAPVRVLPSPMGAVFRVGHGPDGEDDVLRIAHQCALNFLLYESARALRPDLPALRGCPRCNRVMVVGDRKGRRRDARFCSAACKDKSRGRRRKKVRG